MKPRPLIVALLVLLMVAAHAQGVAAAPAAGEVELMGGGFGHGVGLSQYGAQGMALDGYSGTQIATHYFVGTSVAQIADTLPPDSFLLTYPEPLWVGLLQNKLTFKFRAIGGDLELCQAGDGEGPCPKSVVPHDGELWSFTYDGNDCQFAYNGPQGNPGDCSASISWNEGTRVELPDLGLSFAHGTLKIRPVGTVPNLKFHVSLAIDIDDYVLGIDEMPPSWQPAALQAQAIAARTYAVAKAQERETSSRVGTLADPGFADNWRDLCWCHVRATPADQNYDGWDQEQQLAWAAAANATAGQVLTHPNAGFTQNGVIEAFYSSSSSGVTETNVGGFGSSSQYPYLLSVDDHWASDPALNPLADWTKAITETALRSELAATSKPWHADFDTITGIALVNGPPESTLRITGQSGGTSDFVTVPGWWLRSTFGLTSPQVRSVWYSGVKRVWGTDRYATAAEISNDTFSPGAAVAFVAGGENFPDALAAGAAAAKLGGPVLLTRQGALPWVTAMELSRLQPAKIVVVGGEAAVSSGVAAELARIAPVERVAGVDRYATAAAVSALAFPDGAPVVYVAAGTDFADALAGGSAAAAAGGPVLLVRPDSVPPATAAELSRLAPASIVILGGTSAVEAAVESALSQYAPVRRIGGGDRYETASLVSQDAFPNGAATVYVAIGTNFPDGLGGAAAAGAAGGPVLLIAPEALPNVTRDELVRLAPDLIVVLGGPGVVTTGVETTLQQLFP